MQWQDLHSYSGNISFCYQLHPATPFIDEKTCLSYSTNLCLKEICDAKIWEKFSEQILNACNVNYNGGLQTQKACWTYGFYNY